jgi:hypothetical protein
MTTLVAIRHFEIQGHVFAHGVEVMPGLLTHETANKLLDDGWLKEYNSAERRSLYRLFALFSGCKDKEQLSKEELTAYTLPP